MNACSYELYVEAFRAARAAIAEGDGEAIRAIRGQAARAHGVANLVCTLAHIEAQRGAPERTKADVCRGVLCSRGCPHALPSTPHVETTGALS